MWRHVTTGPWTTRRLFPSSALDRIEAVIGAGERRHSAELRVAIEDSLGWDDVLVADMQPRERAIEVFADLGVWDTEANNGVLVYLLLADHHVEILADRGANRALDPGVWNHACRLIHDAFAQDRYEQGVVAALDHLNDALAAVYPPGDRNPDELRNRPAIL